MDATTFPTLNHLKTIHCFQYSVCIHFWYLRERQLTWDMPKIPSSACNSFKGDFPTFKLWINIFVLNTVLVVEITLVHSLITGLAR